MELLVITIVFLLPIIFVQGNSFINDEIDKKKQSKEE